MDHELLTLTVTTGRLPRGQVIPDRLLAPTHQQPLEDMLTTSQSKQLIMLVNRTWSNNEVHMFRWK